MAGASPAKTQELLDRSFHEQYRRNTRSTFHCGSSNSNGNNNSGNKNDMNDSNGNSNHRRCGQNTNANMSGERERAQALYVACKFLPSPLLGLPGERIGMLTEAARTLKKIGDRKKLNDCYQLMKSFGGPTSVSFEFN